ncbi:MAG: orotidine 5'-phosphate decarboxylase [Chloroflexi bacterium]|nr:orotidine 5'-phosphate decarboxylase [Chloroflexota bacterium]
MWQSILRPQLEAARAEQRPRAWSDLRLQSNLRYLQLAFNEDWAQARRILPLIPQSDRILIEAGTPYIKNEGLAGIRAIREHWPGPIVADLKTVDGGAEEVAMVRAAGATAATVLGSSPVETLDRFISACADLEIDSMIDMLGVSDPLRVMMQLAKPPQVVVLHRGRDEEGTRGKVIGYRHVNRVRSKFDVLISAAGGVDLREARSAIFNGASIVVVNIVSPGKPWEGIRADSDVGGMAQQFLATIE